MHHHIATLVLLLHCGSSYTGKSQKPKWHDPLSPVVYPPDYCERSIEGQEFDFIVVGSGPAGATVSRRLAENPSHKVLLLEAGGDPPELSDITHHDLVLEAGEKWSIQAEPSQRYCQGFPGGRCHYTLAKMLGGNSVINYMNYMRGNHEDFDEIAKMGIKGWSWKEMLPYFKKLENYTVVDKKSSEGGNLHSHSGPLPVNRFASDPFTHEFKVDILSAIADEGFVINQDLNGASQIGFGVNPGIVERSGYRANIAKAYLLNIPDNLKVCKHATVVKLIVSSSNSIAGINFIHASGGKHNKAKMITAKATKEYILAAGALNTPQILERSGIGSKSVLEDAEVPLKLRLEGVGENLHERFANVGNSFIVDIDNQAATHPFAAGIWNLQGFLNLANYSNPIPTIQIQGSTPLRVYKSDIVGQYASEDYIFELSPIILRQAKPGYVHITQGKNADSPPKLHINQYTSKAELNMIVKASKLMQKVMKNKHLAKYKIKPFVLKECAEHKSGSESEILCQAKQVAVPLYNLAGTCRMGSEDDSMAVVDHRLKLHGIKGVRIVDLSVMPKNPRGGAEIPTIAVAERAADLIKEDWKKY